MTRLGPHETGRNRHSSEAWQSFSETAIAKRRLVALGLGTIAFSMQDILLEPYGGQVLHLAVGTTTILSAVLAAGGLSGSASPLGFWVVAWMPIGWRHSAH